MIETRLIRQPRFAEGFKKTQLEDQKIGCQARQSPSCPTSERLIT